MLNPRLYNRLNELFGDVWVVNEDQTVVVKERRNRLTGKIEKETISSGERYYIDCPVCGDSRHRLSISYRWGEEGRHLSSLICYNEQCFEKESSQNRFFRQVRLGQGRRSKLPPRRAAARQILEEVEPPERLVSLVTWPGAKDAADYLRGRFMDPEELERRWGIQYVLSCSITDAEDRIYIPIHWTGKLRTWQARYPGELPKGSVLHKYYTRKDAPINRYVYNIERAARWQTIMIHEGVIDAWSSGECATAIFGKKKLMTQQLNEFKRLCHRSKLIVMFDAGSEEYEKAVEVADQLRSVGLKALAVPLGGSDPGALARHVTRDIAKETAAMVGWDLKFARW